MKRKRTHKHTLTQAYRHTKAQRIIRVEGSPCDWQPYVCCLMYPYVCCSLLCRYHVSSI